MRYLSLFSGIEGASVAWHPLGWECAGVSEIEPFPCAVIAHHYPTIPNLGDVTKITEEDIAALGRIDLVVFGSPCQDLSVAGLRKGFICESTDTLTRSGLFFVAMRIVAWARKHNGCRFALWENVPGSFSSSQGRDFAAVVGAMAGLEDVPVPPRGWGNEGVAVGSEGLVEWATLDAQWFGVAQRRRRVFALADFGNWSNRPPILLEPESLRRDTPPRREAGEEVTPTIRAGAPNGGAGHGARSGDSKDELIVPIAHSLRGEGFDASEFGVAQYDSAGTLRAGRIPEHQMVMQPVVPTNQMAVAVSLRGREGGATAELGDEVGNCLRASSGGGDKAHVLAAMSVRRLTPVECERLQGFPDNYSQIPWRKKPASECPDGPRYKALGNSWAVPVVQWIGRRIHNATRRSK